jgi:tetratricopeptide (TPR) repeat protein
VPALIRTNTRAFVSNRFANTSAYTVFSIFESLMRMKSQSRLRESGYSREAVLFAMVVALVVLTGVTAFASRMYHKTVHVLADQWFAQGEADFQAGHAADALNDYRNALVYAPYNSQFQFHLAKALAATGREEEAQSYLLSLLSESPGSGEINLELARIAARKNKVNDALRYYHSAIYGGWEKDPAAMRWSVRLELIEYLLNRGTMNQAEAEIIAAADDVSPGDVDAVKKAGALLLRVNLWNRALTEFRSMLAADRHDEYALEGAGVASFHLGQYVQAYDYFNRLPQEKQASPQIADMVETSRQVLEDDPFVPKLSAEEKAERTSRALAEAESHLQRCAQQKGEPPAATPPVTDLQKLYARKREMRVQWNESSLRLYPSRVEEAMALAFATENAVVSSCGPPQGPDRALWLLAQSRVSSNK